MSHIKSELEKFDKLEVTYTPITGEFTEPLMLNDEQEKVIKAFLVASHLRLLERVREKVEREKKIWQLYKGKITQDLAVDVRIDTIEDILKLINELKSIE